MEKATSELVVPRADDASEAGLAACRAGIHGLTAGLIEPEDEAAGTAVVRFTCLRCGHIHRATYRRDGARLLSLACKRKAPK